VSAAAESDRNADVMPARAVKPWTWARVLRDHGPRSRDFICAMLTLRTWMDDNGHAFPSLRTWAAATRMSVNTLTKHYRSALRDGWLGVEQNPEGGQAWKRNCYRAAVPSHIQLPEKDEMLANALISQFGDIHVPVTLERFTDPEGVSRIGDTPSEHKSPSCVTHVDAPPEQTDEAVSTIGDTPSSHASREAPPEGEGVSNGHAKVCQTPPEGPSKGLPTCITGVSAKSRNSLITTGTPPEVLEASEVLRTTNKSKVQSQATGATAADDSLNGGERARNGLTRQQRLDHAIKAIDSGLDYEFVRRQYELTPEDVKQELDRRRSLDQGVAV
jgi:hypothetical protein